MDSKELRNLHEAYLDVYVSQEVVEAVKGASRHDTEMRKAASTERKAGIKNRLSPAAGKENANKMQRDVKFFDKLTKKNKNVVGLVAKEDFDIFDTVLEFLQVEGYAETLEEAEWMMANVIDEQAIDIILGEAQLDELSVNKMLAYVEKGEKNRADLNKKWDKGTATHRERMRVLGREEGEARASDKVEKKTGKRPYEMNALDKARYAVTKEEYMDEAEGSYGQTPKSDAAYTALATGKGKSKTKSLAFKHAIRSAADRYNSDKPYSHRIKMTQSDRDYHRGQSENHGKDREGIDFDEFDTGASGPGGKPKGKKLERQRKTGVSEAQVANRDPDKYEAGQQKKSAPVRGEKTPMPPRGDKRREDFEKWYAANVR